MGKIIRVLFIININIKNFENMNMSEATMAALVITENLKKEL